MPKPCYGLPNEPELKIDADDDEIAPLSDWVPDKLEQLVRSPVGCQYCIGNGQYRRLYGNAPKPPSRPPRCPTMAMVLEFLAKNSGSEYTSKQVSAAIGRSGGDVLTTLRRREKISGRKINGTYHYSHLKIHD